MLSDGQKVQRGQKGTFELNASEDIHGGRQVHPSSAAGDNWMVRKILGSLSHQARGGYVGTAARADIRASGRTLVCRRVQCACTCGI